MKPFKCTYTKNSPSTQLSTKASIDTNNSYLSKRDYIIDKNIKKKRIQKVREIEKMLPIKENSYAPKL